MPSFTERLGINGTDTFNLSQGKGDVIPPDNMDVTTPLILDIDLDAFCCYRSLFNISPNHDGVANFETRIHETVQVVRDLPRPDLITITRSQGSGEKWKCYVPSDKVFAVHECLTNELSKIYR